MVKNNNNIYGRRRGKKRQEKNIVLLIPRWGGGVGRRGGGCSFKQVRRGITSQVPHSLCFTPQKGYAEEKVVSFEDCQLPTTIICL